MIPTTIPVPRGDGQRWLQVVYAKDQPEYIPLPAVRNDTGTVVTCWKLSWRERLEALICGRVYLTMLTFNKPLHPVTLGTCMPSLAGEASEEERR